MDSAGSKNDNAREPCGSRALGRQPGWAVALRLHGFRGSLFRGLRRVGSSVSRVGSSAGGSVGSPGSRFARGFGGGASGIDRRASSFAGGVHGCTSRVHCGPSRLSSLVHGLGGAFGGARSLLGGLATAAGEKGKGNGQRKPRLAC